MNDPEDSREHSDLIRGSRELGEGRIGSLAGTQFTLSLGPFQSTDASLDEVIPSDYELSFRVNDFPVDALVDRVREGRIRVPDFQREFIWERRRSERFVESLLLGLPVPAIFLAEDRGSGKLLVVDGQQRLAALLAFYEGNLDGAVFSLDSVSSRFAGLSYSDLEPADRARLDDATITGNILRQHTPEGEFSSIYFVFERLNSGSVPLTRQEIRRALNPGEFQKLVDELADLNGWQTLVGHVRNPGGLSAFEKRSREQELVVRVLAFHAHLDDYNDLALNDGEPATRDRHSVIKFLDRFFYRSSRRGADQIEAWRRDFTDAVEHLSNAVAERRFSPNAAMFEVICVVGLEDIANEARWQRLAELGIDPDFRRICGEFTSNSEQVGQRYAYARNVVGG